MTPPSHVLPHLLEAKLPSCPRSEPRSTMALHRPYTNLTRAFNAAAFLYAVQVSYVHAFTCPLSPPKRQTRYHRQETTNLYSSNGIGVDDAKIISFPAIDDELKRIRKNFEDEIRGLESDLVTKEKDAFDLVQRKEREALEAVRSGIESKEKEVFDLVQLKEKEAFDAMKGYFQEKVQLAMNGLSGNEDRVNESVRSVEEAVKSMTAVGGASTEESAVADVTETVKVAEAVAETIATLAASETSAVEELKSSSDDVVKTIESAETLVGKIAADSASANSFEVEELKATANEVQESIRAADTVAEAVKSVVKSDASALSDLESSATDIIKSTQNIEQLADAAVNDGIADAATVENIETLANDINTEIATAEKVAEAISEKLSADVEAIVSLDKKAADVVESLNKVAAAIFSGDAEAVATSASSAKETIKAIENDAKAVASTVGSDSTADADAVADLKSAITDGIAEGSSLLKDSESATAAETAASSLIGEVAKVLPTEGLDIVAADIASASSDNAEVVADAVGLAQSLDAATDTLATLKPALAEAADVAFSSLFVL